MADLRSTINQSGQQTETSEEELKKKSQQQGLAAPPISPLGAASLGVGPHAAKMAGTGQQKGASLAQAVNQPPPGQPAAPKPQTLSDANRYEDYERKATEQEAEAKQLAEDIKSQGYLSSRLKAKTLGQFRAGEKGAVSFQAGGDEFQKLDPEQQSLVSKTFDLSQKLAEAKAAVPPDPTVIEDLTAQQAQAIKDVEIAKIPNAAQFLQNNSEEQITSAAQDTVADTLPLSQAVNAEELNSIAETLGITLEEAGKLTQGQVADEMAQAEAKVNQVDQLQAALSDPNLAPSQRQSIVKQLRELGGIGLVSADVQAEATAQEIEDGRKVTVNGKEYSLEELLSDDSVTAFTGQYLTALESGDTATLEALKGQLGEDFTGWIQENQQMLQESTTEMKAGQDAFAAEYAEYENLTAAIPDMNVKFLDALKGLDPTKAKRIQNELANLDPELKEGIDWTDPIATDAFLNSDRSAQETAQNIKFAQSVKDLEDLDPDQFADRLVDDIFNVPGVDNWDTFESKFNQGLIDMDQRLLDMDKDGILDSKEDIAKRYRNKTSRNHRYSMSPPNVTEGVGPEEKISSVYTSKEIPSPKDFIADIKTGGNLRDNISSYQKLSDAHAAEKDPWVRKSLAETLKSVENEFFSNPKFKSKYQDKKEKGMSGITVDKTFDEKDIFSQMQQMRDERKS